MDLYRYILINFIISLSKFPDYSIDIGTRRYRYFVIVDIDIMLIHKYELYLNEIERRYMTMTWIPRIFATDIKQILLIRRQDC